ncbi:hypothetical protein ACI2KV_30070 [Micromonospora chokoriensis]
MGEAYKVDTGDAIDRRVKFYGPSDYGTYAQVERAARIVEQYSHSTEYTISDVLEFYNAQLFADADLLPTSYSESQRAAYRTNILQLRRIVARFFNAINDTNVAKFLVDVNCEYHADLLELLSRHKVYGRCAASVLLPVLDDNHIGIEEMLANKGLVSAYDQEVRERLVSNPSNAESLIRKHLARDATRQEVHLPTSLTADDGRALLDSYLESDEANPNFVELISLSQPDRVIGLDPRMKLKAKRKHERWTEDFFKNNSGVETGCEVRISDTQAEAVKASTSGLVVSLSYGRQWLEDGLDEPTVLNNFLHLFEFADRRILLTLPSYHAQLGIFERFLKTAGKKAYMTGAAFHFKEQSSFLQTALYQQFLRANDVELESVIAWFFSDYLKDEFEAVNFKFLPSSRASTNLEKCRHIFAETESIVKQFSLYVENGELDTDLLAITSEQVRYKNIPSLMAGKYVYRTNDSDIQSILHLLFSDQSGLTYINEELRADSAAQLIINNRVAYDDVADYQKTQIDYLAKHGILECTSGRIQFANIHRFIALRDIFHSEAASYYHYSDAVRAAVDEMVARHWVERRGSLLSNAEASYFNYCLNQAEFSNGPDLRNKYLHGSQADTGAKDEHFGTYITAIKLLIALVIKINDDFCLHANEDARNS